MSSVYLLLGSNLGYRELILKKAAAQINDLTGSIVKVSSVYETEPWGFEGGCDFLNQALIVETGHSPHEVLNMILSIESHLGRKRTAKKISRTLDIDILFYDDLVVNEPGLIIPHPLLHLRRFALIPMNEIAADYMHPVLNKPIAGLLSECPDQLKVTRYEEYRPGSMI
jgi:2-amino-4-hydroxy-6-hydroxymethyldihydropteridine diphosphokinase